ncbi:MAG: efflux RND transporter periplasmic adaptor subunit [Magnetospirillum sp.]|nr:efflux RND transporter periplasmic adaptor subunit [Magnetospirillum sp.]
MSSHSEKFRASHRQRKGKLAAVGIAAAIGVVAIAGTGIVIRTRDEAKLAKWTDEQAIPSVELVAPQRGVENQELVLPGNVQAYFEAPIYARVSGYLKNWYQDIGAHVKAGQLLAEIDAPDLDQQYQQAQADLAQAKANAALAEITAKRWQALVATNSVSRQEADEKTGDLEAKKAALAAAQANVARLQALEGFKRIIAPFDGVVTARKTDVGALINTGSGIGPELFAVADVHKMRVYVRVPQAQSAGLREGMKATLLTPQRPNKLFPAVLVTTAEAITEASRTMLVELEADNANGELPPGTYAEVHFKLPANPNVLRLPTSSLVFRQNGTEVATVGPDGKVVMKPVKVGRDLGTQVEIVSGLGPDDRVVKVPPDSLEEGDPVRVAETTGGASGGAAKPSAGAAQ